jgi:soluble lytic murein transglycosylase-like protein
MAGMAKSALFQSMMLGDPYGQYGAPNNGILGPMYSEIAQKFAPKVSAPVAPKGTPQGFTIQGNGGNTDYRAMAGQYADQYGVPADLFERQINQESGFNPNARGGSGEIGIAQFMPGTAQGLGINPADPAQALGGAASLMKSYYDKYGSWALALIAYNAGGGVADQVASGNTDALPASTQGYVSDILGSYQ